MTNIFSLIKQGSPFCLFAIVIAVVIAIPGFSFATHYPSGSLCYECHTVSRSSMVEGTHLIRRSQRTIDLGITQSDPTMRCLFCHQKYAAGATDQGNAWNPNGPVPGARDRMKGVLEHFNSSSLSHHPVAVEDGTFPSENTGSFDCLDCHDVVGFSDTNFDSNPNIHGMDASLPETLDPRRTLKGVIFDAIPPAPVSDLELSEKFCFAACHGRVLTNPEDFDQSNFIPPPAHDVDPAIITINDVSVDSADTFVGANSKTYIACTKCHGVHNSYDGEALLTVKNSQPVTGTGETVQLNECDVCHSQDEVLSDNLYDNFNQFGHGKMGVTCDMCHEPSHDADYDGFFDPAPRLRANLQEEGTAADDTTTFGTRFYSNCRKCHAGHKPHTPLPTKGGQPYGFQGSEFYSTITNRSAGCRDCHDQHGTSAADSAFQNDTMIRRQIGLVPEDTRLPDPTDEFVYNGSWYVDGQTYGVCDNESCHDAIGAGESLATLNAHLGGTLGAATCSTQIGCHQTHLESENFFSEASKCDACHGFPPANDDLFNDNPNGVGVHKTHVTDMGYDCQACHYQSNHNQSGWSQNPTGTDPVPAGNVDVNFQPDRNMQGTYNYADEAPIGVRKCYNLTCHNPDDASTANPIGLTGKGDSRQDERSAPEWWDDYDTRQVADTDPSEETRNGVPANEGAWKIGENGREECVACHLHSFKTNPDGGSHYAHESPAGLQKNYPCRTCHTVQDAENNVYDYSHARGSKTSPAPVVFDLTQAGNMTMTGTETYDPVSGECSDIYCHGFSLNNGGTDVTPLWSDYSTANCNTCHAAMAESQAVGKNPAKEVSSGKHITHYTSLNGARLPPNHAGSGCEQCHNSVNVKDNANCYTYCHVEITEGALGVGATAPSPTHVDGNVDFLEPSAPSGYESLAATTVCDGCHGNEAGIAPNENIERQLAKHFWYDAGSWLDSTEAINVLLPGTSDARTAGGATYCLNCHQGTLSVVPVFDDVQDLWINATAQAKDFYLTTGHGNTGSYNATLHGQPGPGYECRVCHDETQAHIDLTSGNDLRLKTVTETPALAYTSAESELCLDCHKPGQSAAGQLGYDASAEASVHSGGVTGNYNAPASAPTANGAYGDSTDGFATNQGYQCGACHDGHGTNKLAMIIGAIDGAFGGASNPQTVIGLESSDLDMSDLDPTAAADDGTCDLCHAAAGQIDAHPDSTHPGSHNQGGNGYSCVSISCHEHSQSFRSNGQTCIDCHGDGGSAVQIAWQGASAVGKTTNYGSHLRAAAGEDLTLVADWNAQCKKCHPAAGHTGGAATAPAPPESSTHAGVPNGTNMRQRLGIDYPEGIQLGGTATSGKTTEAEICWDCHGAGQANDQTNEWGFNTDTNGSFPVIDLDLDGGSASGQNTINNGWLYTDANWTVETYDWTGTDGTGAYRKDAYQHQDYDGGTTTPLSQKIVSVHSANFAAASGCTADPNDVDCGSSVENNVDATGAVTRSAATKLEARSAIRCSYCHDVHDLNKADINNDGTPDDPSNGPPHLRHAWMGNPYPPDMPPVASYAYPMTGGPFNTGSRYFSAGQDGIAGNADDAQFSQAVPRLWADPATSGKGGYWIDANSGRPTDDPAYDQLEEEGGLCVLCHGSDVDNMDYWTSSSLWRTNQTNGHSNAVLGGTGSGKTDLFSGRRGSAAYDYMGHQDGVSVADYGTKTEGGSLINVISPFSNDLKGVKPALSSGTGGASSPPRNNGWYGGTAGSTAKDGQYIFWYHYFNQTIGTDGTGGSGYPHQFTCSKCHSPHASSLPALLTTNCLDQGKATWTGAGGAATPSGKQAMNCHRKESTDTGWHRLAPGQ